MDTLMGILGIGVIVLIVFLVIKIRAKIRHGRSCCPKCKKEYEYPDELEIIAGDLEWEEKTRTETKGDFKYEITYRQYYRIIGFNFSCKDCGHEHFFNKRVDIWRDDSGHSMSDKEELALIKDFARGLFDDKMFEGKEITIYAEADD